MVSVKLKELIKTTAISTVVTFVVVLLLIFVFESQKIEQPVKEQIIEQPKIEQPKEKNKKDTLCLQQNIHYEAGGESFFGKLAVGIVTINRQKAKNKTICEIVYEPNQFSWTTWVTKPIEKFSVDVVQAALIAEEEMLMLKGLEDAIYFHAKYVYPDWAKKKKYLITIGEHLFYGER